MAEISGNPIVNRSDSVAASYLKAQDFPVNPVSGNISFFPVNLGSTTPTSGGVTSGGGFAGAGSLSIVQGFTTSGHTITAAVSGAGWGPAGYFAIQVSGNTVVVPYFNV